MRLDYKYFLQRRNLTTQQLIKNNNIQSYEDFLIILDGLRVKHIPKIEFDEAYSIVNQKPVIKSKKGTKNETATKSKPKVQKQQSKKTNNRSAPARDTHSAKRKPTKQSGSVSTKK